MYFAHKRKMMECQATLPCRAHVLVEEEAEVRQQWSQIARDKKLALFVFSSVSSFLPTLHFWDAETEFYLDQDMYGIRGQGVELAKVVRAVLPCAKIYLVTAYPRSLFLQEVAEGIIDDVFGKYPEPFDRPEYTRMEKEFQEQIWKSAR